MHEKLTNKIVDDRLITFHRSLTRIGDVAGATTPIEWDCDKHHHRWVATPNNILNGGTGCPLCSGKSKLTNKKIDQRLKENNRTIIRLGNTINGSTPIKWKCKCHYTWAATPDNILNKGTGCPLCSGHLEQTNEVIDKRLRESDRSIIRIGNVINIHTPIHWQCTICFHMWEAAPTKILNSGTGCNRCRRSGIFNKSYFSKYPLKKTSKGLLYLVEVVINNVKFIKVGITEQSVVRRFHGQITKYKIKELASKPMMLFDAYTTEQEILHKYIKDLNQPDCKFSGRTECVRYDPIILTDIIRDYFNCRFNDQVVV